MVSKIIDHARPLIFFLEVFPTSPRFLGERQYNSLEFSGMSIDYSHNLADFLAHIRILNSRYVFYVHIIRSLKAFLCFSGDLKIR